MEGSRKQKTVIDIDTVQRKKELHFWIKYC